MTYTSKVSSTFCDEAWDSFVLAHQAGRHLQTTSWAHLKSLQGWKVVRLCINEGRRIVAGAQLLVKPLPVLGSYLYLPKGPLLERRDVPLALDVIRQIHGIAKTFHGRMISIQPAEDGAYLEPLLTQLGYIPSNIELAPTATVRIDLSADRRDLLSSMRRQTRQNILRSQKEGIQLRLGSRADVSIFHALYSGGSSRRQDFVPYNRAYFYQMWDIFSGSRNIALMMADYKDKTISALLLIAYKDTVFAKSLGWSGTEAARRPNDAVFWGSIEWAKKKGYRYFDFEGVDRNAAATVLSGKALPEGLKHSPSFLKMGYGGQTILFPSAYVNIPNPLLRCVVRVVSRHADNGTLTTRMKTLVRRTVLKKAFRNGT